MSDEILMIPASFSSMVTNDGYEAGFGSSSGFSVGQPNPHQTLDIFSNTSEGRMVLPAEANSGNNNGNEDFGKDEDNSVNDEGENQQSSKRPKRFHRHTQHQIQELEAFFKECPHPDDKERKELGRLLGLEPLQIKFWFQNKRTQLKTQNERQENEMLRAENQRLRAEFDKLREDFDNFTCQRCNGPLSTGEVQLEVHEARMEYARLKAEHDRLSSIVAKYMPAGKPITSYDDNVCLSSSPPSTPGVGSQHFGVDNVGSEEYGGNGGETTSPRSMDFCPPGGRADMSVLTTDLAAAATAELVEMARIKEPLWVPSIDGTTTLLDQDQYLRLFSRGFAPKPQGYNKTEASRESAIVIINHLHLVETLMNVSHWAAMFSNIVSRAVTVDVLSTGHQAGSYDGALLVIYAEFQVPTPHVPTRDCYFVRYCKNIEGTWVVVDVSLDNINPVGRCRKRPSGCLIEEVPNGYTKVTWVEHVEVEDNEMYSNIYKPLVDSCIAFGAKRWIATLDRQCERIACTMATNIPSTDNLVIASPQSRKSILKLAERMVNSFCSGVSSSTAHQWTLLSGTGSDDVRIMIRKSVDDPGRPSGIVLSASTSFWLPTQPKRLFDFLRSEHSRTEWDILSNSGTVTEMAHIANGRETGNCVSLLRVNSVDWNQSNMLILQESSMDPTASFVIYAPVDIMAMNNIIGGGDPDYVALLPSGFAILPDGPPAGNNGYGVCGSLLTISFQILVDSVPTAKLSVGSVATVNELIHCTAERIKASLSDVLGTYDFKCKHIYIYIYIYIYICYEILILLVKLFVDFGKFNFVIAERVVWEEMHGRIKQVKSAPYGGLKVRELTSIFGHY